MPTLVLQTIRQSSLPHSAGKLAGRDTILGIEINKETKKSRWDAN